MIIWNLDPEIFSLGPLTIRWYGMLFGLSFLLVYHLGVSMLRSENEDISWGESLFTYIIISTILGARLGHVFFYAWDYYSENLLEIPQIWNGGLASHGGVVGVIIALWIHSRRITKRSVYWSTDRIIILASLVGAFIRVGNLMNSEIYGKVTSLPWGFIFERNGEILPKHPTQIYEALSYLSVFILLYILYKKTDIKQKQGFLTGIGLIAIFSARFSLEFIKEVQETFEIGMLLNMGQILSLPFILLGIYLVVRSKT